MLSPHLANPPTAWRKAGATEQSFTARLKCSITLSDNKYCLSYFVSLATLGLGYIAEVHSRDYRVSTDKFLKQRAVNVSVDGHYTLPNWYDPQGKLRTFECRTNRVSPFRMIVDVPVVGKVGDYLTSYFRDFGKLDGCISDTRPGCFLLELDMTFARREQLANKLVWLEDKQKDPEIIDLRNDSRVIPANTARSFASAN